jgi:hypothetical protein
MVRTPLDAAVLLTAAALAVSTAATVVFALRPRLLARRRAARLTGAREDVVPTVRPVLFDQDRETATAT